MKQALSEIHFIEDSNDEIFLTRLLLKKERVNARLVHHYQYASFSRHLEEAAPQVPMLVFVDLNMPGVKGTEIVSDVVRRGDTNIIIGICSGSEDPEDIRLSYEAGAFFFVNKPLGRTAIEKVCAQVKKFDLTETVDRKFDIQISC